MVQPGRILLRIITSPRPPGDLRSDPVRGLPGVKKPGQVRPARSVTSTQAGFSPAAESIRKMIKESNNKICRPGCAFQPGRASRESQAGFNRRIRPTKGMLIRIFATNIEEFRRSGEMNTIPPYRFFRMMLAEGASPLRTAGLQSSR